MQIAEKLKRESLAEYLLYMWQIEDTIRAYGCSLARIRREYIEQFDYTAEQKEEEADWFGHLVRMMNQEGRREQGHLEVNRKVMAQLETAAQELSEGGDPFYNSAYLKVLPFVVELRNRGAHKEESEVETCMNALYGTMMLRLQGKELSPETAHAVSEISTYVGLVSDHCMKKDNKKKE